MEVKRYEQSDLDRYLKNDFVLKELEKYPEDFCFASQNWFKNIPAKRMIYADVYNELLNSKGKKILDVGGGFCSLSRKLIENHDYTLLDIMTRDDHDKLKAFELKTKPFWKNLDWAEFIPEGTYDYIIASDIFPNVDQRLEKFLRKFKPYAKKIVLTLTCYDKKSILADFFERTVQVLHSKLKRVDADKLIFVRAPDTEATNKILKTCIGENFPALQTSADSLFKNGRIVYKVILG